MSETITVPAMLSTDLQLVRETLLRTAALRKTMRRLVETVLAGAAVSILLHIPSPLPWAVRSAIMGIWGLCTLFMIVRVSRAAREIRILAALSAVEDYARPRTVTLHTVRATNVSGDLEVSDWSSPAP